MRGSAVGGGRAVDRDGPGDLDGAGERDGAGELDGPGGQDGPTILVAFARALAAAGVAVGSERTASFLAAVAELGADDRRQVYWAGRLTLTGELDDLPVYDAVFDAYFASTPTPRRPPRRRAPVISTELPLSESDGGPQDQHEDGVTPPPVKARAAADELLRHRDLAKLTPTERVELARMLALLAPGLPQRLSRRRRPAEHRHGPVDARRTIRAMLAAGGEPGVPARHRRRRRPRRIVLLIDVSGSMAPYADALLRFAHVLVRYQAAAAEVFTIGTRLSRVTKALQIRDPDLALAAAAEVIPDFSGGTRLGEVLRAFLDRWGQRGTAHGAIVVIFSDGWERGSTELLAEQVARLHRLARRVIWVNPHKGKAGYVPVQSGIVAVLPHVDRFVAGHSLATLEELLEVVRDA